MKGAAPFSWALLPVFVAGALEHGLPLLVACGTAHGRAWTAGAHRGAWLLLARAVWGGRQPLPGCWGRAPTGCCYRYCELSPPAAMKASTLAGSIRSMAPTRTKRSRPREQRSCTVDGDTASCPATSRAVSSRATMGEPCSTGAAKGLGEPVTGWDGWTERDPTALEVSRGCEGPVTSGLDPLPLWERAGVRVVAPSPVRPTRSQPAVTAAPAPRPHLPPRTRSRQGPPGRSPWVAWRGSER